MVLPAQPRARRYPFSANIEVIEVESESTIKQRTCDLSLFGCFVKAPEPWAIGSKVLLKITYKGSAFTALGHVVHKREDGMGVKFSRIKPKDEMILEIWMDEMRSEREKN